MRKYLYLFLLFAFLVWVYLVVAIFYLDSPMPDEGVWYCEQHQIQLSFDDDCKSYVIIDGQVVDCVSSNDRGSKFLRLLCVETENEGYDYGEEMFCAHLVKVNYKELVLKTEDEVKFIFKRVG